MGLFDKLKKKNGKEISNSSSEINPQIYRIFNSTKEDMREKIFYGDVLSAQALLLDLSNVALKIPSKDRIDLVFQIYLQVWIRSRGGFSPSFSTPSYIEEAVSKRFASVSKDVVIPCVKKSLNIIYQHEPELCKKALEIEAYKIYIEESSKINMKIQDMFISDSEYGLVISKPIFVNGFGMDEEYLSHLASSTGEEMTFKRMGSSNVNGIAGAVDIYHTFLSNEKFYKELFVCVYGTRNTKDVPEGFVYIK